MDIFPLPIFPEESLATSVSTTVWVGVWVIAFFNLRLGWTASGFIVPGYLVPLLIAKPASVVVILSEAVLTYLIVYALSEAGQRYKPWCSFFGRDRFFALVIVTALIRVVMDGWLLPWLGSQINATWNVNLDYRNHLHSYGLIIVSLVANYLWKPGLVRGLSSLLVTIVTTYIIVRFGLMEFTNFSIGSLRHTYADIASSLLASPKAYIVLVTTAFFASWLNMRYCWDFNGILIPALLALQWHAPWKIVTSFVEAAIVLVISLAVLRLPLFQKTTVEGTRKVLLFFNVAFIYRLLLGFAMPVFFPDVKVTDMYGFGYILSTLLAIKAHEQMVVIGLVRSTLQATMVGAVGGSLLGFMLLAVPIHPTLTAMAGSDDSTDLGGCTLDRDMIDVVQGDKQFLYQNRIPESYQRPVFDDLGLFSEGVNALLRFRNDRRPSQLALARKKLSKVNYRVHLVQDRYLYLRERSPARGWGLYALDLWRSEGILVQVPAPLDEWAVLDAGLFLFHRLQGGALAIAGASRHTNADTSADILTEPRSIFETFHRLIAQGNVLEVRGDSSEIRKVVFEQKSQPLDVATDAVPSAIWIKSALPDGLDLRQLKELLPDYRINWRTTALANVMRDRCWSGFAELTLSRRDCGVLLRNLATLRNCHVSPTAPLQLNQSLSNWLLELKSQIAGRGTDEYAPPKFEELLYVDHEVLKPLIAIARRCRTFGDFNKTDLDDLNAASAAANVVGCQVTLLHDTQQNQGFLVLSDTAEAEKSRHWGTCVFRCGLSGTAVVEVPRPLAERNTYDYGVNLFTRLAGDVLILAGADPRANQDGTADVVRWANRANYFNLVMQVVLRELRDQPLLLLQVRGVELPLDTDMLIATSNGDTRVGELRQQTKRFVQSLQETGTRIRFVDGSPGTVGYEATGVRQALALCQPENKEFASLWVAPHMRLRYGQRTDSGHQNEQFEVAGIRTVNSDLAAFVLADRRRHGFATPPSEVRQLIEEYLRTRDIIALRNLRINWSEFGWTRVIDTRTQQVFLVTVGNRQLPLIVNLGETGGSEFTTITCNAFGTVEIESFAESGATWLEMESE